MGLLGIVSNKSTLSLQIGPGRFLLSVPLTFDSSFFLNNETSVTFLHMQVMDQEQKCMQQQMLIYSQIHLYPSSKQARCIVTVQKHILDRQKELN